jgi:hypothetical protein
MRRWPQQQHWRGNSIILPTCSTGFNNRSIGKATESTTLHTATALVVNLPVKVKARTSKFVKIKDITSKAPLVT